MTLTKVRDRGTTGISTDLQPIKSDITALALREATNESSASFNLPNQHIDTFATDTLGTKTNAVVSGGLVSPKSQSSESGGTTGDFDDISWGYNSSYITINTSDMNFGGNSYNQTAEQRSNFLQNNFWWSFKVDHSSMQSFSATTEPTVGQYAFFHGIKNRTSNINDYNNGIYSNNSSDYFYINFKEVSSSEEIFFIRDQTSQGSATVNLVGNYITFLRETAGGGTLKVYLSSSSADYVNGTLLHTFSGYSGTGNNGIIAGRNRNGTASFDGQTFVQNSSYKDDITSLSALNYNATGTVIQNTNTVGSAKTEVGGTILYKDNQGTATLGTDLRVYFTCDGGSNWTEASSYNAITPVYSTGIKVKLLVRREQTLDTKLNGLIKAQVQKKLNYTE